MSDQQPMTIAGKAKIEEEVRRLIQDERPKIIKAIEIARGHGDLSENADYDAAKERQAFTEARIGDLQGKLAVAQVVDTSKIHSDKVIFGAHIVLEDLDIEAEVKYQIVGEDEADVKIGKISIFSPLARSLIGKKQGDVVDFRSPKGEKEFEIKSFYYE